MFKTIGMVMAALMIVLLIVFSIVALVSGVMLIFKSGVLDDVIQHVLSLSTLGVFMYSSIGILGCAGVLFLLMDKDN